MKGYVKLMQRLKIAHSFLQSVLNIQLSKNVSKPTSKNGERGRFNPSLLTESF